MRRPEDEKGRIETGMRLAPVAVNVSADVFEVVWENGHTSRFSPADLRAQCNCAKCEDQREKLRQQGSRQLPVLGPAARAEIASVQHAGRYGFDVRWRDGHHSILTYEFLYSVCPCSLCRLAREIEDIDE
ncbi:MAG TPA: DUF971 domain-containing protein [Blastocatellia bacterium]|nr:DUF971 domain-containing protein [Blastocatellia bacterium]